MPPASNEDVARSDATGAWLKPPLAALFIAVAAVLAFHNSFGGAFVFDDEQSIPGNPTLASLRTAWSPPNDSGVTVSGRPLLNFSFALNRALGGNDPWSYHALNLAIHLGCAWLLFGIARRLLATRANPRWRGRSTALATGIAVLWAVHPLQTESVTYVVQRAESLSGFFLLLTLYAFVRGAQSERPRGWWTAAFLACLAGTATKETIVVAPLLVALADRAFFAGSWRETWRRRRGLYLALASTWLPLFALVVSTGGRGGTFALASPQAWWRYDLTQFVAVTRYLALSAWPSPLVIDYGTFWIERVAEIVWPVVLVLSCLAGGVAVWRRSPAVGFLAASFFLLLAPSSLPPGTLQMIVEHRMYLSLAAAIALAVPGLHLALGRRMWPLAAAVAMAFALLAVRRNDDYATPLRLFEDTVAKRPTNGRAMALLGDYYRRAGQPEKARAWLERSLRVEPRVAPVLNNLGNVWLELGEPAQALARFEEALRFAPADMVTLNNLGNTLVRAGRFDEGIARLEAALRREPGDAPTQLNLANALAQAGRMPAAAEKFAAYVQRFPNDAEARSGHARVLQALGRRDDAVRELQAAVQLRPDDAQFHDQLGVALGRAGRLREALTEFEAALRINPNDATAGQNAAVARKRLGLDL